MAKIEYTPVTVKKQLDVSTMKTGVQARGNPAQVLATINQIGQALTTSLHTMDITTICRSILRNLNWENLFVFDVAEVCLWDTQTKTLNTVICWPEDSDGQQTADWRYALNEGYSGWIATHQKPLLITDTRQRQDVLPKVGVDHFPYVSYLGVPLKVGLKFIGTLELATTSVEAYTEQDLTVLEILANQAAITIDHVRLFQETQRNVSELALLFDASSELSSTLSYDQLLHNLSRQMMNAFPADDCAVYNFDEVTGNLKLVHQYKIDHLHQTETFTPNLSKESFGRAITKVPGWQQAKNSRSPLIFRQDVSSDPQEIEILQTFESGVILTIPLINRDRMTGLLALFSPDPHDFTEYQIQLAQSLANQANIALDNARLFSLTDQQLQNRVDELAGLQRVSRESNSTLDLDKILHVVLDEAMQVTRADFGNINLYDAKTGKLVAGKSQSSSDFPDFLKNGNQAVNGQGVVEQVLHTGKTVLIPDVRRSINYVSQGQDIHSAVIIPIYYGGEPVGTINLESQHINFFNKNQLRYLEAMANQAAVAIGNAQAFQEQKREREQASRRVEQLSRLSEISNAFRTNRPLREVLEEIAYAILESVGYNFVLISLVRNDTQMLYHEVAAGIPLTDLEPWRQPEHAQPVEHLEAVLREEFRLRKSYFIPATQRERWQNILAIPYLGTAIPPKLKLPSTEIEGEPWQPGDALFVPLRDIDDQLIGLLTVENPDTGVRPTPLSVQTLEIFANQAATAIENARLFESERQRRSLADTLRGIAEAISSQLDFDELLNIMLQELANVIEFDSVSVQQLREDRLVIIGGHGWENSQAVIGLSFSMEGHNPNRVVIETQEPVIVKNVRQAYPESFGPPHEHIQSWLGVPLTYGTNVLGLMALDSNQPDFFDHEDAEVLAAFANQVAVAMQNARLFEEARNQVGQLKALTEVAQALNRALDLNEILNLVLDTVFDLINCSQGSIWLIDAASNTVKIANTQNIPEFMVNLFNESDITTDMEPFASIIASGDVTVIKSDTAEMETIVEQVTAFPGDVTYVPLKTENRVIGILALEYLFTHKNTLQLVTTLANLAAIAIDNTQLVQRLNQFNEELERRVNQRTEQLAQTLDDLTEERDRVDTLYQITRELSTSFDLDRILSQALYLIEKAVGVTFGSILLLDRNTGQLIHRAAIGRKKPLVRGGYETEYNIGHGLAGKVIQQRELRIISDLHEEPDWVPKGEDYDRHSAIVAPLVSGEEVVGTLLLFHSETDYFTEGHAKLVTAAGTQVANAINNAELYRLITDQANRLGVMLRTQAAEATKNEAILKGIADGVLVLDPDRRIVLLNPKAVEILNIDGGSLENEPLSHILEHSVSADSDKFIRKFYHRFLEALELIRLGQEAAEFRIESDSKAVVVTLTPVALGAEEIPSIVSVIRDISREAEIDRIRNEFISTVSHELRTPMTSIKGYADLLMSGDKQVGDLNPTQQRFVKVIQSNANRLTDLVNDILEISRIETGRVKLELETLNLADIINEVTVMFEGQLVRKSVNLSVALAADLPPVFADKARLMQILVNLIGNAWQYTSEGGDVTVRANVLNDEFVQIDVIDTGIGIVEKDLDFIFDRFFRSERTEVQVVDGTGLGLSITKSFVDMLGGEIWAKSKLDAGSTFSFTLPIAVPSQIET